MKNEKRESDGEGLAMAKGKKAMAMNKKVITFEQLNNAFDDAMRIAAKRRTEKQRKVLRINFAQKITLRKN